MRILVSDYIITKSTAIGSVNRKMVESFCSEHDFTIFAKEFDNPNPKQIKYFKLFSFKRPLLLLFFTHHIAHFIKYWLLRAKGEKFDLIQGVECNIYNADITRVGFCHRAYLENHFNQSLLSLRGILKYLNHWVRSKFEPIIYNKVKYIVVPSQGLKNELSEYYNLNEDKIVVIENPIDHKYNNDVSISEVEKIKLRYEFKRYKRTLLFVALGHFERKGLNLLLNALKKFDTEEFLLLVIGGDEGYLQSWREKAKSNGIDNVKFLGFKADVRPYFHAVDIFVLPSEYETFSQVSYIAASVGKPLVVTRLYGVEEFMKNKQTGYVIEKSTPSIIKTLRDILKSSINEIETMGKESKKCAMHIDIANFEKKWANIYQELSYVKG